MTEKKRGRVSIGLYTGAGVLWPTVVRLLDRGFLAEQLGIAALASTAEGLASPAVLSFPEWKRIEGLLGSLEVVEGPGGLLLAASRNVRVPMAKRGKDTCAAGIISLRSSRVWAELEQPIVGGATALAVVAPSTEQQWRGTRILLEQSAYPVQTHEIRAGIGPCTAP